MVQTLYVAEQARQTRVLVVDDEPNIVDVVSMALRHHGFDVDSAQTGAGAVSRVRERRPDVMVLDVMLPDMDGFEVASGSRPSAPACRSCFSPRAMRWPTSCAA